MYLDACNVVDRENLFRLESKHGAIEADILAVKKKKDC